MPRFNYDEYIDKPLNTLFSEYKDSSLSQGALFLGLVVFSFFAAYFFFTPFPPLSLISHLTYGILGWIEFLLPTLMVLPFSVDKSEEDALGEDILPTLLLGFSLTTLSALLPTLVSSLKWLPFLAHSLSALNTVALVVYIASLALPPLYLIGKSIFADKGYDGYHDYVGELILTTFTRPAMLTLMFFAEPVNQVVKVFDKQLHPDVFKPSQEINYTHSRQQMADLGLTFSPDPNYNRTDLNFRDYPTHNAGCRLQPIATLEQRVNRSLEEDSNESGINYRC